MSIEEVLSIWSTACEKSGVKWYLFRDALLCAEGYGFFPEELKCAQVAVSSAYIHKVLNEVVALLPESWKLSTEQFVTQAAPLLFLYNESTVLELHLLHPYTNEDKMLSLHSKVNGVRRKLRIEQKLLYFLLGRGPGKYLEFKKERAFNALLRLIRAENVLTGPYSDNITVQQGTVYSNDMISKENNIAVDGVSYPVFYMYKEYLREQYGDYETGLYDEIGVGITKQEMEKLKGHQQRCVEALNFVQKISEEYRLRYCLIAGSVLGAVRHGGFIPWDDDIDLGIRVEELERFETLIKEHLPSQFTLEQAAANYPYPRMFSKICYEGRCCIDLWPLVPTYKDGFAAELTWYFGKLITKVHKKKINYSAGQFDVLAKIIAKFLPDSLVMWLARKNERKYCKRNTPCYVNLYSIYSRQKETFERNWLNDTVMVPFEGINVPIVGHTNEYLTHLYGDYMKLPAPWKRNSRHEARFQLNRVEENLQ